MSDIKSVKKRKASTAPLAKPKPLSETLITSPGKRLKRDLGSSKTIDKKKSKSTTTTELASSKVVNKVEEKQDMEGETEEEESDDEDILEGFESGSEVDEAQLSLSLPAIPKPRQVSSVVQTSTDVVTKPTSTHKHQQENEARGTVYLGRIPHGFYEHQMRAYFSQFGTITRLRLSRNKMTGKSKHYAFIEFASASVATIVAETMNNYLLFGHILKCRVIPQEECNDKMWVGANRKWKVVPLAKLRKARHEAKKSQETWDKLELKELRRRSAKELKWKEAGIDYSL